MPITAAPSICERMRSGLAAKPQSMAMWTSGTSDRAVIDHFHPHAGAHISDEAAMRGEAEAFACRHVLAPAGLVGGQFRDIGQTAGVDGIFPRTSP